MWKATLRGILARKVRLALTAVAVMLGVAFVTGTYVLTDTSRRAYDGVFAQTVDNVDLFVQAFSPVDDVGLFNAGAFAQRQRITEQVVVTAREVDGVGTADGVVLGYAQFVDHDGDAIHNGILPTVGGSWPETEGAGPAEILDGRPPMVEGEVGMDAATARANGFEVGDPVRVILQPGTEDFTLVGIFELGGSEALGGLTFAAFDLSTAQRVFNAPEMIDRVYVTADPGVSIPELKDRLQRELGPVYEVLDPDEVAADAAAPVHQFFELFNAALLAFAAVGLVVGGFIIFNTFSILVAQRTRELGLLRAMGANGRQIMTSVVAEAVLVAIGASALGIAVGVVMASALVDAIGRFGFDVPSTDTVLLGRTIVVAVAVGLFVTVGSSIYPALRASRVPPIAAIHDVTRTTVVPLRRRAIVGALIFALGLVVVALGLAADARLILVRIAVVGIGAFAVFLGTVALIATFARPLARVVGWPLAWWLGVTGALARGNAMRNPRRTAATASALVVGLSLVCLVAIFAASIKSSLSSAVEEGIRADYVLTTDSLSGFPPLVPEAVVDLPAVESVAPIRLAQIEVDGSPENLAGVDTDVLEDVIDLGEVDGSIEALEAGGIFLQKAEADAYDVGVGDTVVVSLPARGPQPIPVAGVYSRPGFLGGFPNPTFLISGTTYTQNFGEHQQLAAVYVKARPGQVEAARGQLEAALDAEFPNVNVQSREEYRERQERTVDQFVAVLVALLLMSELIAVLGIINTLFLSVYERTREIGLLRAVGMSRRQVRRVIRGESVIIAVIGAVVGIAVGLFWAWAFTRALQEQGISEFTVPPFQIAVFLVLSIVAGLVAALLPAWRAGRLDVLEAIATE